MTFDSRWKNPPGADPQQLFKWAQDLVGELRKGQSVPGNAEEAQDAVGGILVDSATIDFTYTDATPSITAEVINASITYAKMQNISATKRALGRNTAGAGDTEEVTAEQVINWIGTPAQGDVFYQGVTNPARLAASTAGFFLKTQGAGANPAWAAQTQNPAVVASGAVSAAATLDIAVGSTYDMYEIELIAFVPATDNVSLIMRFSQSGSYLAGASDYQYAIQISALSTVDEANDSIIISGAVGNVAGEYVTAKVWVYRPGAASFQKTALFEKASRSGTPLSASGQGGGSLLANTDAIDGVRFLFTSGNIASGYYAVRGYTFT